VTIRLALVLALGFAAVTALNLVWGWFDADDVRRVLESASDRPVLVGTLVVGVLAVDSLLSVPTMGTAALAGYLLGAWWGAACSSIGVMFAGSICYFGARLFGGGRAGEQVRAEVGGVGATPLLFSRALPMLPEILSAIAGVARMPYRRYAFWFALGNVPWVVLAAFAGSRSGVDRPWPAITAAIGIPLLLAAAYAARRYSMTMRRTPK